MRETGWEFFCLDRKNTNALERILLEKELVGFPLLAADSPHPKSLILAETSDALVVLSRFSNDELILHSMMEKSRYQEIRDIFESGKDAVKNAEKLAALTAFRQLETDDLAIAQLMKDTFPEGIPEPPAKVKEQMEPGDHCGIFASNAWWLKKADGTLHIIGNGVVNALSLPNEESYQDPYPIALEAVGWYFQKGKQRKIIIGEGIERIQGAIYTDRSHEEEMETILFPASLKTVPNIRGQVRKMTIPPSIRMIDLANVLFYQCGGHWDPVYYSVQELTVPSEILLEKNKWDIGLPDCEEIYYWKTLRFYGAHPIPDLQMWYDYNLFTSNLHLLYPEAWDCGQPGAYGDALLAFVREQKPTNPIFGMAPTGETPWTEGDYNALRSRIRSYAPFDPETGDET